ncbi:nose resistant to fluoxetine protein 6-like isoform X2 [Branchiostoma floridae x Branchiostoma belcheri]
MKLLLGLCFLLVALRVVCAQNVWDNQIKGFYHLVERMKAALQREALHILTNLDLKWHEVIWTNANMSRRCEDDMLKYREDLFHRENYALHMLDACGKPPSGILTGNLNWLGSYSQCAKVTTEEYNITFNGKYFLAQLVLTEQTNQTKISLKVGLCVPDSCTEHDVILQLENNPLFGYMGNWRVLNITAYIPEVAPINPGTVSAIFICALLCILQLVGTLYDVIIERPRKNGSRKNLQATLEEEGISRRLLLAFSIYNNLERLFSTKQTSGSIPCLHGIRFLSLSWVILGHTYIYSVETIDNPVVLLEIVKTFTFQVVLQTILAVDTFFFLGGLLLAYLLLKRLEESSEEGKTIRFLMLYVQRYLRLTPTLLFVIMLVVWVLPQLFMGPMWHSKLSSLEGCRTNWWKNILYINNLLRDNQACLDFTWYLANDMQFFIIGVPIVYLLYRCWYVGLAGQVALLLVNFAATAVVAVEYDIRVDFFIAEAQERRNRDEPDPKFTEYYIKPWVRIGPYLVGMLVGWVLYKTREMRDENKRDEKMVLWLVCIGWCTATATALAVVYGMYGVYNGAVLTYSGNLFFVTVHRVVWAMAIGWMVIACYHGYGGVVNTILSWNVWVPLSRLTYSAYLIHPIVMYLTYHTAESAIHLTTFNMIHLFLGHLMLGYGLAVLVFVFVESPTISLLKITVGNRAAPNHPPPLDYKNLP